MQILGHFDDGDQWSAADLTCMTGLGPARVARALEVLIARGWVVDGWDDRTPPRRWNMEAKLVPCQGDRELPPLCLHEAKRPRLAAALLRPLRLTENADECRTPEASVNPANGIGTFVCEGWRRATR